MRRRSERAAGSIKIAGGRLLRVSMEFAMFEKLFTMKTLQKTHPFITCILGQSGRVNSRVVLGAVFL